MKHLSDEARGEVCELLRGIGTEISGGAALEVRDKGEQDLVTELDFLAESRVKEYLRRAFPEDTILSEETCSRVDYADRLWVLDPLDGTVNRARGIPFYAVSLALLVEGDAVAGWVYDPEHGELFSAYRGEGATLNGQSLHGAGAGAGAGVRSVALTSKLVASLVNTRPEILAAVLRRYGRARNYGAQALHLCYVAAGRLGAALSLETKLWDNAAGCLIVAEAGGRVCRVSGAARGALGVGSPLLQGAADDCLAAHPEVAEELLQLLRPTSA